MASKLPWLEIEVLSINAFIRACSNSQVFAMFVYDTYSMELSPSLPG